MCRVKRAGTYDLPMTPRALIYPSIQTSLLQNTYVATGYASFTKTTCKYSVCIEFLNAVANIFSSKIVITFNTKLLFVIVFKL